MTKLKDLIPDIDSRRQIAIDFQNETHLQILTWTMGFGQILEIPHDVFFLVEDRNSASGYIAVVPTGFTRETFEAMFPKADQFQMASYFPFPLKNAPTSKINFN